jgi:hypothetical protein
MEREVGARSQGDSSPPARSSGRIPGAQSPLRALKFELIGRQPLRDHHPAAYLEHGPHDAPCQPAAVRRHSSSSTSSGLSRAARA